MANYRPELDNTVPLVFYKPEYKKVAGVATKTYPQKGVLFYGSFKTYGGTERDVNGVYSIMDTARIVTWFRPDLTSDCLIERAIDGARYEIIGEPENVNMRNQFLKIKVRRAKGGV